MEKNLNLISRLNFSEFKNKSIIFFTNKAGELEQKILYNKIANEIKIDSEIIGEDNIFLLKDISVKIPDLNLYYSLNGNYDLKSRDIVLNSKFQFSPAGEVCFFKDFNISGFASLNSGFIFNKNGMEFLNYFTLKDFNFKIDKLKIENGNAEFLLAYNLESSKNFNSYKTDKDFLVFNYLTYRGYEPPDDNFKIEKIKFGDIEIDNIKFDIKYKNNVLNINRGILNLAGGSISLNNSYFDISDLKNPSYMLNIEITGVDILKLKKLEIKEGEDTTISGNIRLKGVGFKLSDIGKIYGGFNITHIGNEITLKFLDLIDPAKKDKKIGQVRSAVERGALPKLFSIEIKNGLIYSKFWYERPALYKDIFQMVLLKAPTFVLQPSPITLNPIQAEVILKKFLKK